MRNSGAKQPMDLSSLTIFVKYGSELLFGKLPRKTMELLKSAEKINDEEYKLRIL